MNQAHRQLPDKGRDLKLQEVVLYDHFMDDGNETAPHMEVKDRKNVLIEVLEAGSCYSAILNLKEDVSTCWLGLESNSTEGQLAWIPRDEANLLG